MEFSPSVTAVIGIIVTILVTALFIHFGAGMVVRQRSFGQAIITAIVGSILAGLVLIAVGGFGWLGILLALTAWALVAGFVYRTSWIGGVVIGVMAWLLWWLVNFLVDVIFGA